MSNSVRRGITRSPRSRLNTLLVAAAFAAAGGLTGFDIHPLSTHGPHVYDAMALGSGMAQQAGDDGAAHHSGHPEHGPSTHCTCLGACAGGGAPAFSDADLASASIAPDVVVRDRPSSADLAPRGHTPYLLPFPNPPPTQA